ncbi:MarR family winged helix-turn-helix transcriptional regulator [Vibrio ostreicida]|uniref:MarR family winged helix-turn-helix transcriptional regulator n=1 Tax=Vibrio ostreicida TaxID=526588 RepID=UPI003B5A2618
MRLENSLIELERFCSKAWRVHAKDDPLALLSFNEYDYLRVIQDHPEGVRITDLAKELKVSKPSASNMVVRLQKKGFVKRLLCHEDGRSKRIILTEKVINGMSMEQTIYKEIAQSMNSKLTAQEAETLIRLLDKSLTK